MSQIYLIAVNLQGLFLLYFYLLLDDLYDDVLMRLWWCDLAGGQVPTKATLSLPSSTKQGRKK